MINIADAERRRVFILFGLNHPSLDMAGQAHRTASVRDPQESRVAAGHIFDVRVMAASALYEWLDAAKIGASVELHIGLFTSSKSCYPGVNPPYRGTVDIGIFRIDKVRVIHRAGKCSRGNSTTAVLNAYRMIISKIISDYAISRHNSPTCCPRIWDKG
jgi:hypothetical protein